ncbi:unnamed protein product [Psylliodes chrysocephalus]|uniref:Uncharacterized protein n=1 Tax=Psylliodes chrysocephalus TaxID=3402493 RepID=A0A9P0D7D8_9CUCU|nr:unnamed protein product [Psylliodes chrysocephala]
MESSRLVKLKTNIYRKFWSIAIKEGDTVREAWTNDSWKCKTVVPHSRGKHICILHYDREDDWVNDALLLSSKHIKDNSLDYHQAIEGNLFESWFKEKFVRFQPNVLPKKTSKNV